MNLFEALRHDIAKLLRDAAEYVYPEKPRWGGWVDLDTWPKPIAKGLMEFCADEDVCGEVGLAMLAASSLKRRAVKHAMMEDELHGIIEEEGGGMDA